MAMATTQRARAKTTVLPDALVVGPQRTGTTWIHRYLEHRGDVALPRHVKETWFFTRYYSRGVPWYGSQFARDLQHNRTIEVAPTYFHHCEVPGRIAEDLGRIPVVCTLRHPAERTLSLYLHMRRYGMTRLPFRDAAEALPELIDSGRYGNHLERWRNRLGAENVLTLFFEDLRSDPDHWTRELCRHLSLEYRPIPAALHERVNESRLPQHHAVAWLGQQVAVTLRSWGLYSVVEGAKRLGFKKHFFGSAGGIPVTELTSEDRRWLLGVLRPEIDHVEQMLGVDLSSWKV